MPNITTNHAITYTDYGVVPQEMKIARVIPLFKSGDKSLFTNYRPVSVLPVFWKESSIIALLIF